STDGTYEYFQDRGIPIFRQKSRGICGAYWEALEVATGDVIIAFSPDNNSLPEAIPKLVAKMKEGNDMVVASRYRDGAKSEDDDMVTAFGNWMFTKMVNILFGAKYTDTLVMLRAFRKDLIQRIGMDVRKTPTFEILLNIRCAKYNLKVAEVGADEPARLGGVRKMRPLYNGMTLLIIIIKEIFYHKVKPKMRTRPV
ncbi:MAG: glycosyltransferase, partial [Zetaproteobacteria bacterium]|nr:glycosyltransferase [Zetaproteobacteria bacterium]